MLDIHINVWRKTKNIDHHFKYHNMENISITAHHIVNNKFLIDLAGCLIFFSIGQAAHVNNINDHIIQVKNV
jgi:hypothetical protein